LRGVTQLSRIQITASDSGVFRTVGARFFQSTTVSGLGWFNSGVHNLRTPFAVRAGVHCGEVVFPDNKDMVEVSDFTIDVTGHLQEHGSQNMLWVSKEAVDMLSDTSGFKMLERQVDSHGVFEWAPPVEQAAAQ
jgi:hypothetical protein